MKSIIEASQERQKTAFSKSQVIVQLMQPQDVEKWDAFVLACPDATFFHRAGWQRVIERAFGHKTWFYYAEQDGKIIGV